MSFFFSLVLGGGKTRINSPPLRLSLAKSYGAICICWSASINIISWCVRSCNMLHATSEQATIASSAIYFRAVAVGVAVAFTSLASSASFATFNSEAAWPLLGAVFYVQTCVSMCVCTYVHMYSAYVSMYYTHECYNNFLNTFVYFSFAFRVCFILWRYQNFTLRIWRARHLF